MIDIRRAASTASNDAGWLQSWHHFSFGSYFEESNRFFGPLCVFNHDIIAGGRGFGAHPHREMEIVSVVLRGELKHEDSAGNTALTTFGGIQRMTAGTGIIHSETNPGEEPVELLQIWFMPEQARLAPDYETTHYDTNALRGRWLPVVKREGGPNIAAIHQDAAIYLTQLEPGQVVSYEAQSERLHYLFIVRGSAELTINRASHTLSEGDAVRLTDETAIRLSAIGEHPLLALLIDMTPNPVREGGDQA
ncbi:quercetin 2,3-dioxygenase [Paenibacillus sp. CCS19]|uniref:pirin family protein n=1 Tax=Paenibacillus sp. CCS19 TaxID=3158387 RepID=UPI00256BADE9|nr:pirin family protein [Paenibacillus cellulosilyticus]GMK39930.1 quercetin 2,3-dioxygenase [Paenibacillus cellulosilyticus]